MNNTIRHLPNVDFEVLPLDGESATLVYNRFEGSVKEEKRVADTAQIPSRK